MKNSFVEALTVGILYALLFGMYACVIWMFLAVGIAMSYGGSNTGPDPNQDWLVWLVYYPGFFFFSPVGFVTTGLSGFFWGALAGLLFGGGRELLFDYLEKRSSDSEYGE